MNTLRTEDVMTAINLLWVDSLADGGLAEFALETRLVVIEGFPRTKVVLDHNWLLLCKGPCPKHRTPARDFCDLFLWSLSPVRAEVSLTEIRTTKHLGLSWMAWSHLDKLGVTWISLERFSWGT
jgi:hypothetical protein